MNLRTHPEDVDGNSLTKYAERIPIGVSVFCVGRDSKRAQGTIHRSPSGDADKAATREKAMDEIAADYIKKMVKDTSLYKDFVKQSRENLRIGKKILQWFKDILAKIKATVTGKEARNEAMIEATGQSLPDVEKAVKLWEEALKASEAEVNKGTRAVQGNEKTASGQKAASLGKRNALELEEIQAIQNIGRKSVNQFNSEEIRKTERLARRNWEKLKTKSPFFRAWFGDWRAYDTTPVEYVSVNADFTKIQDIPRGDFYNGDTGWRISSTRDGIDETANKRGVGSKEYRTLADLDSMLKNAVLLDSVVVSDPSKRMGKKSVMVHHMYCPVLVNGRKAIAKLYVSENLYGDHKFYLTKIEEVTPAMVSNVSSDIIDPRAQSTTGDSSSNISIAEIFAFVKERDADYEADSEKPVYFDPVEVNPALLNKDGTPKVFYHGTPSGDFTVFHNWQYFTENKSYADVYQNQGASSNGYKQTSANPKTYETYLAPKKIFDTRNAADKKIFDEEFYGKWGNGTPLSEKGLPDWTDGDDLIDFIEENGYDYGGVFLDEGATGGYGDAVNSRGISLVVRDSTAIKSATDNIGTFDGRNPDIRYSLDMDEFTRQQKLKEARDKHGVIPEGENPTREVKLPTQVHDGKKVSYTIRTALEAGVTPEEMVPVIEEKVLRGGFADYTKSNKDLLKNARKWVQDQASTDKALGAWQAAEKQGLDWQAR